MVKSTDLELEDDEADEDDEEIEDIEVDENATIFDGICPCCGEKARITISINHL